MKRILIPFALAAAAAATAATLPALAESVAVSADHSGHTAPAAAAAADPAVAAFEAANAQMHAAMVIDFTGNPDVDFIRGMIPHHQGAVDMAKVVLQYGKDPEVRAMAEGVIKAQEAEIAWMKDWLAKNGG